MKKLAKFDVNFCPRCGQKLEDKISCYTNEKYKCCPSRDCGYTRLINEK